MLKLANIYEADCSSSPNAFGREIIPTRMIFLQMEVNRLEVGQIFARFRCALFSLQNLKFACTNVQSNVIEHDKKTACLKFGNV